MILVNIDSSNGLLYGDTYSSKYPNTRWLIVNLIRASGKHLLDFQWNAFNIDKKNTSNMYFVNDDCPWYQWDNGNHEKCLVVSHCHWTKLLSPNSSAKINEIC